MADFRFLPIDEVLSNISFDTDNEDTRDSMVYTQWIYRALRQIGYVKANIREKRVDASSGNVEIPCELAELIDFQLLDNTGLGLPFYWHGAQAPTGYITNVYVTENDTTYGISSNARGVHQAYLKYWAHPVDEEGNLLIPEPFLEAILAWCDYRWTERQRKRKPKEVPLSEVRTKKQDWDNLRREAESWAKLPPMPEADRISRQHITGMPNRGHRRVALNRP